MEAADILCPWLWINRCILGTDTRTSPRTSATWPPGTRTSSSTSAPVSLEDPCEFTCVISTPRQSFSFNRKTCTVAPHPISFHLWWPRAVACSSSNPRYHYCPCLPYYKTYSDFSCSNWRFLFIPFCVFRPAPSAGFWLVRRGLGTSRVLLICHWVGEVKRDCMPSV